MIIYVKPKGEPDHLTRWSNPNPHLIQVTREDENNWYGYPIDNPDCPELQYPKFAWEQVHEV